MFQEDHNKAGIVLIVTLVPLHAERKQKWLPLLTLQALPTVVPPSITASSAQVSSYHPRCPIRPQCRSSLAHAAVPEAPLEIRRSAKSFRIFATAYSCGEDTILT